ncbi:MAG: hypothetical protein ACYDG6_14510 [Thermincolia bacterium]
MFDLKGAEVAEVAEPLKINLQLFALDNSDTGNVGTDDGDTSDDSGSFEDETDDESGDVTGGDKTDAGVVDQRTSNQPPEVDAAFANMRREVERRDGWVRQKYGHMGITTWDQYQEAVEQSEQEAQQAQQQAAQQQMDDELERLKAAGYDPQEIWAIQNANPEVQQLRQTVNQLQQVLNQQQETQKMSQMSKAWSEQLGKLREEHGDMVPADLETFKKNEPAAYNRVLRGYPLDEAWKLENLDKIQTKTRKAAGQRVLNSVNSKNHLKTEGIGDGDNDFITIDPEELRVFRGMFPKKSDKDFAAWKKQMKGR